MSYLAEPRISFRGRFLSDVSTNNNIAENFRPDEPQQTLWNTFGGSTVELLDCGSLISGAVDVNDPASDFVITGATARPSGKMVDLDPEWQMSSELWGMSLHIADRHTGELALEGSLAVCAFRDLWTRQSTAALNGQGAGARFVSVLEDLTWGPAAENSPALQSLQSLTEGGRLSVGIHTFGYFYNQQHPRYRTGSIMLHLGPWHNGEPDTALVHRRLQGVTVQQTGGGAFDVTGDFDFLVSNGGQRLHLDVGHALRIADVDGWLLDYRYMPQPANSIESLLIGLLPPSGAQIEDASTVQFAEIPLPDVEWYRRTGGILSVDIPLVHAAAVQNTPIAIFAQVRDGPFVLLARETEDGIFYRADSYVLRLETGSTTDVTLYARKFGRPLSGFQFQIAPNPSRIPGPLPSVSTPAPTDGTGTTAVTFTGVDPGNPRGDLGLDGAVFNFGYGDKIDANGLIDQSGTSLTPLDVIVVHARNPYPVPDTPNFVEHIEPVMTQYAQLYPIMSEHLFDLSDYDALVANRQALLLAFGRPIEDSNYMPVTRDLSEGHIATIVKWLNAITGNPDEPLVRGTMRAPLPTASVAPSVPTVVAQADAKSDAATKLRTGPNRPVIPASMFDGEPNA